VSIELPSVSITDEHLGVVVKVVDEGPIVRVAYTHKPDTFVDFQWCDRMRSILDAVCVADRKMAEVDELNGR